MNGSFYEQLGGVAGLFEQWGACERTVVACALARRVPWPGLRLLQRAVDAALAQARHIEDERLEREANDEVYIASLLAPDDDEDEEAERVAKAVSLVALVRAESAAARAAAVAGAARAAQRAVDGARRRLAPLARQLLCYLLVHPALSAAEQRTLTEWLRYLENHMGGRSLETWSREQSTVDTNIWGSSSQFRRTIGKNIFRAVLDPPERFPDPLPSPESFSKNGRDVDISIESERLAFDATISQPKSQRSNSLTPPSTLTSSSAENLFEPYQKPRSFSLSSDHSSAMRMRMQPATGSETRLDELRARGARGAGGAQVAGWLKTLRLHKYAWLFAGLSLDQLGALDDACLHTLGVTKGARHKILLSISKLAERGAILRSIEEELTGAVASGPAASGAGAPGAITPGAVGRALERLKGVLLSPMSADSDLPEHIVRILQIASKLVQNESPGQEPDAVDPLSLHCWLVEKALHHEAFRAAALAERLRALRHRLPPRQFYRRVGELPRRCPKPRWRMSQPTRPARPWGGAGAAPARNKSHSYPPDRDDYYSLDMLCQRMADQAID